jgi:endonuclease/exonuclease/phosphatase family metal-dependent hydrolase
MMNLVARQAQQCTLVRMRLRVLTWNLFHGRSVPPARHELIDEFASQLDRWAWDVALLQEVPPWWPEALARRPGVYERTVLTSRNALLPLRRALAVRWPNAIKSHGGGSNAILVREAAITEHRTVRLALLPERRWMHAVRLEPAGPGGGGVWIGNLHASGPDHWARREAARAGAALRDWAGPEPALLGGDFNLSWPEVRGFVHAGGHYVDHVLVSAMRTAAAPVVLDAGRLSDHVPVLATVEPVQMSLAIAS